MTAAGADRGPAEASDGAIGRLFVVATPIGNLGDVTYRAIEVLGSVPLIAAEDTRLSRRLLTRYEIRSRLVSYHARNAMSRMPALLAHLRKGEDMALITDAGTPGVSDPGDELVRAWASEGGVVVPLPGASAVLAAIVVSGVAGPRWTFEGFLPRSGGARRQRLARIAADERGCVVYEAPGRVAATLADLATACGQHRAGAVCRELTKMHEEIVRGTFGALAELASGGRLTLRGEFVIVVGEAARAAGTSASARAAAGSHEAGTQPAVASTDELSSARAEVERLIRAGSARGEAARRVSGATGIPRRRLYEAPRDEE